MQTVYKARGMQLQSNVENDVAYKFKRYEDASLVYTDINTHERENIGGITKDMPKQIGNLKLTLTLLTVRTFTIDTLSTVSANEDEKCLVKSGKDTEINKVHSVTDKLFAM